MSILIVRPIHVLGESRYEVDCTFLAAHGQFMFQTEQAFPTSLWVIFVATHWNRITIPGRCALCRDARVSQAQDVLERPSTCTSKNAHSTPSNRGF
jgi:hypothetical protein